MASSGARSAWTAGVSQTRISAQATPDGSTQGILNFFFTATTPGFMRST